MRFLTFLNSILFLILFSTINLVVAEDPTTELEDENNSSEIDSDGEEVNSQNNIAIEAQSFSDLFRSQSSSSFKGVILGNVLAATEHYIYVKPLERDFGRMYIYLDDKTMFSKMINGKRQRGKKDNLIEGNRVAARVLVKEGIVLADEFFLVEGDFDPRSRYRKMSYAKKKSGDGAEASHGAAKPKAGGHH